VSWWLAVPMSRADPADPGPLAGPARSHQASSVMFPTIGGWVLRYGTSVPLS
jgi:hypothetical protein